MGIGGREGSLGAWKERGYGKGEALQPELLGRVMTDRDGGRHEEGLRVVQW